MVILVSLGEKLRITSGGLIGLHMVFTNTDTSLSGGGNTITKTSDGIPITMHKKQEQH